MKQADRAIRKMPRQTASAIRDKLDHIGADPYASLSTVTRLKDRPAYRLRVGKWRLIYEIHDDEVVILVIKIATRGNVYR